MAQTGINHLSTAVYRHSIIHKAESLFFVLLSSKPASFERIWTKFGMWNPYIPRMVMGVELYLQLVQVIKNIILHLRSALANTGLA